MFAPLCYNFVPAQPTGGGGQKWSRERKNKIARAKGTEIYFAFPPPPPLEKKDIVRLCLKLNNK